MSRSNQQISIKIQICSNCKQHAWCTRHIQANYQTLAQQIVKSIKNEDSSIKLQILPVNGSKMGSFQINCQSHLLFSKLSLGYFPHVKAVTERIMSFISDYKNGNDLSKYQPGVGSPIKSNSYFNRTDSTGFKKSPVRRQIKIAYNQQYGKKQQNESSNKGQTIKNKEQQKNHQSTPFIIQEKKQQKKSQKKIQRGQVIIPETKKEQKKSQNFIIDEDKQKKEQHKKESQKKLQVKSKSSQKINEKKIQIKEKQQQSQQFVIDQQQQNEKKSKNVIKDQNNASVNNQISHQKTQSSKNIQQSKQNKKDKKFKNIQKVDDQLVDEMKKVFDEYDKDKSGTLQRKQVKQLMKTVLGNLKQSNLVTDQVAKKWLDNLDIDGDGKLSFEEMVEAFCNVSNN